MASTNSSKWAALRELARDRFPEDAEVADAMHKVEELVGQQPGNTAVFIAETKAVMQAEEDKRVGEARTIVGSRQAWALATAIAAQEEMARGRRRWDEDMATARRACEIHELASQRRHCWNLARRLAIRARQTDGEGSNAIYPGWGDDLL
jgi:hypothetical protein